MQDAGVDGVIIADPGVMSVFHQAAPEVSIHVSTQANCTNAAAARVYSSLGARRVVPARELTLGQLAEMRRQLPEDMEIEAFIHGAMCMAYSGRCMISAYLTGRSANRGACAHPCRWNYTLMEQTRPGEYFPLEETDDGMALLSSRDLNCMSFLEQLVQAGVSSFKIEGRMKSEYYVATVVSAYRRRLDDILAGRPSDIDQLTHELDCVSHRSYCSGFYFGEVKHIGGDSGEYLQGCRYIAQVLKTDQGRAEILLKNAELDAQLIQREAKEEADRLAEENVQLRSRFIEFRSKYKTLLESELEKFDTLSEELFREFADSEGTDLFREERISSGADTDSDLSKTRVHVKIDE